MKARSPFPSLEREETAISSAGITFMLQPNAISPISKAASKAAAAPTKSIFRLLCFHRFESLSNTFLSLAS